MTRLILGGVTLAALGYSLKKHLDEDKTTYKVYTGNPNSSEHHEENKDYFQLLYETKIVLFEETIEKYKDKLKEIKNLPDEAEIHNSEIAFLPEKYDNTLQMYDAANLLALDLKEHLLSTQELLEDYFPKMDVVASDTFSFFYSSKEDSRTFAKALELMNIITTIADLNILNKHAQIDSRFIEELNTLKLQIQRFKEQLKKLENSHYSELSDIILHNQNEKPIQEEFMFDLLSKGKAHTNIVFTIEGKSALMCAAMKLVNKMQSIQYKKALLVTFTIPTDMSLDIVDKAIDRIRDNIDEDVKLHAGTKCSDEHHIEKIGINAIVINN